VGWIDDVAGRASVHDVAQQAGLQPGRQRSLRPCPACNATQRGSSDKRGPLGVRSDGRGWQCFACDARGDALELAALAWTGSRLRELAPEQRQGVRERCAGLGWCSLEDQRASRPSPLRRGKATSAAAPPASSWAVRKLGQQPSAPPEPPPEGGAGPLAWAVDLPVRCAAQLWQPEGAQVLAYLQGRGFSEETLRAWNVGAHLVHDRSGRVVEQYVAIPVPRADGVVVNMRFRSVPGACLHCGGAGCRARTCKGGQVRKVYLRCPGAPSTLFGVHQLDGDPHSTVTIVEGELDVLALWQYGLRSNVVSGTAGAGTWADEWLDALEPYRHHVIAYDDDAAGHDGAAKVAQALGHTRVSRAVLPQADAAACLEHAVAQRAVHAALDAARPMMDVKLARVDAYADELEQMIANPEDLRGLPTGSAKLDQGIGGWAPGLVVVTGDTAAGKTSFTTWVLAEQARRGVPVLGTSFEQRPIGTVQKLLRQQVGTDFTLRSEAERRAAMAQLGQLPIYLLDHYGELDAAACLEVIDYAVRRRGVRVAVVDHLGFLVREAEDERRAIEAAVRSYALAAVQWGITIILICHPNNLSVVQQRRVQLGDLKGASAIRQDAHVGLVVERLLPGRAVQHPASAVHVDKCRSEFGAQGARLVLFYDPEATVYADTWEATPMGSSGGGGGFRVPPARQHDR